MHKYSIILKIIIIIPIISVDFPRFHGLDGFLDGYCIFHSDPICARSRSIFGDLKSLSMTWWQVFRGPPFLLLPLKLYILHFITTLSSLHLSTWPNHLNLPLLMQFLTLSYKAKTLPRFWRRLPILHFTSILSFSYH